MKAEKMNNAADGHQQHGQVKHSTGKSTFSI
jgi:hypothetical protein